MSQPEAVALEEADELGSSASQSGKRVSSAAAVAQSIVTKLAIIALNAITGILSARSLMPSGRGALSALALWPVFLGSALTFGIPSAFTYQARRHPQQRAELLGTALLIGMLTGVLGAVIGAIFLPYWIPQYTPNTIFWARIFVLACPLQSLALIGRNALESTDDFTTSNKTLVVAPALTAVVLLLLIALHGMTAVTAAAAYVCVGVLPLCWMAGQLRRIFKPRLTNVAASAAMLLRYGLTSYGVDLCGAMALYVDQALVVRILAPELMGTYVVALSVSRMLNVFHTSVVMVLFPRAVGQSPNTVRQMTGTAARVSTLATAVAGLCIMLVGPQVLTLLYSAQYRSAGPALRVLVVEVVLAGATTVLSQAFMALGRPGIVTLLQLLGLVCTVPMVLLLTPRYGIAGASLALLLSTCLRLILVLASFPLFLKLPIPQLMPTGADLQTLRRMVRQQLSR